MNERIVFTNPDGLAAYLSPILECGLSIEEIAAKDVPTGIPFIIVNELALNDIEIFSTTIEVDPLNADGVGADYGAGSKNIVIGYTNDMEAITLPLVIVDGVGKIDYNAKPSQHSNKAVIVPKAPDTININLGKAKLIAHDMRRTDRDIRLAPLDREEGFATTTEIRKTEIISEKQVILDANAAVQVDIDGALDGAALRSVLGTAGMPNVV